MTTQTLGAISAGIALVAAVGAWAALFVQRRNATETIHAQVNIGARNSRASVVSANRQRWIDAIRDDVAEFISLRNHLTVIRDAGSFNATGQDTLYTEARQTFMKLEMLRARVEMRLNPTENEHTQLLLLMDSFNLDPSREANTALRSQARAIFKAEWERLKQEASGTNPFVKEARLSRK